MGGLVILSNARVTTATQLRPRDFRTTFVRLLFEARSRTVLSLHGRGCVVTDHCTSALSIERAVTHLAPYGHRQEPRHHCDRKTVTRHEELATSQARLPAATLVTWCRQSLVRLKDGNIRL